MLPVYILSFLIFHTGYKLARGGFNECQTGRNCSACITLSPKCSWCNDIIYKSAIKSYFKKCDLEENHNEQGCLNITNPKSEAQITKSAKLEGETRVSPQAITVKLRPGQPTSVNVKIKTPKNFPIDLYYLMDLSKSMEDDLKQIIGLADRLSEEMLKVSKNFRLGFGGYVDKPVGPFTLTSPGEIKKTLNDINNSQYTFGYKNYLSLVDDTNEFKKTVGNVQISFNVDPPEGSLEALMQVIVCEKDIGWRHKRKARRIVIITTDQTFHYSGDGLLGGVVIPNRGNCLLKDGNYTGWGTYDYPSLSQIRSVMIDNQIVPIFATLGNEALYKSVADYFGQQSGAVAQRLASDSSNIVPLIKEAYEKIAKTVSIQSTAADNIDVKFTTNCGQDGKAPVEQDFCDNVAIGQEVTFDVKMTAKDCKLNGGNKKNFKLKTNFDDIDVTLEMICDCPCDNMKIENSTDCQLRGALGCGMCFCYPGFAGRFCQCTSAEAKNETLCRSPGDTGPVCSGRGKCDCGECFCDAPSLTKAGDIEYIYGDRCECSNTSCGRSNGKICGGPERGVCDCGVCKCNEDWTGPRCGVKCVKSEAACTGVDGVICSGNGYCECNQCKCNDGYIGNQCQECVANCPDPCQDYKNCVACLVYKTGDLTEEECRAECAKHNITKEPIIVVKIPDDQNRCIARDEDDCSFVFTFVKDNVTEEVQIIAQEERICPAEADILAIILGVIAGIVGIGLALLLIWKILATIQDQREFAKFEKDRQNPKWDSGENPIYKKATSTFQNPMYDTKPSAQS